MVLYFALEDEYDEEDAQVNAQKESFPSIDDKVLTILEALLEHMSWK